ncbi:hypothetical protein [Marinagarivorans cellulosilyticus]|uniref:Uncharacterized protein n=1 Tax=Marinagarivorans cellulosilyticus TaxID=2721545 RepID=A0AAN2BIN8_9GAMM|nr:hypothetical protein [Marinagarivorans cellulosilyticus]BCD96061.1 hypothetical protein MARGE09_P0260 [Marinagarivorans cellulosilyticus]
MVRAKKANQNIRTALAMALVIISVAVASWFYMQHFSAGGRKVYRNVTFTDALLECQAFTAERYGPRLKRLTMDSHSSRWEQRLGVYKVFFTATMQAGPDPADTREYWVACDVSGGAGKVRDFDMLEDKGGKSEVQRRNDGGMFGWP